MPNKPGLINIDLSIDDRGEISHCNNFDFKKNNIKRFYKISNHSKNFIRAWHGHKKENKYIMILKGALKVSIVKVNNWKNPERKRKIINFYLSDKKPQIVFIPGGYVHGTQNLKTKTDFIVFSTSTLQESLKDDYRFHYNYWGEWKINYR